MPWESQAQTGEGPLPKGEGEVDQGEERGAKQKGNRGRKQDTDLKQDERIWDAWHSGRHESLEAVGSAFEMSKPEVIRALDRHRKRLDKRMDKRNRRR